LCAAHNYCQGAPRVRLNSSLEAKAQRENLSPEQLKRLQQAVAVIKQEI
jgi:hypothetical protein